MGQHMGQQQIRRFTAVAGIAAVLFYIVTVALIADFPSADTPAQQLAAYVASYSTQLLLEVYGWALVAAATLCFLTGLRAVLRHAAPC